MSGIKVNRRKFLKMLGWGGAGTAVAGCDLPTTVTLEEGKEEVVSYLMPEEYVIPGIGVWYASTCTQCAAGCGLHGRVREGRVLKLEGNPDSPINAGKTCMMGQAGVQAHYNPDRVTTPMLRKGRALTPVSWDEAMAELNKRVGAGSGLNGSRFAWVSGEVSGHQRVLMEEFMAAVGSKNHFVHEVVNDRVWSRACADMLGDADPALHLDKAGVILSLGMDFLGASSSPVQYAGDYGRFRAGKRGVLVQVEPKMTLTGGNADLWLAARPGSEGVLALAVANIIVARGWNKVEVPAEVRRALAAYDLTTTEAITGIAASKIKRVASLLSERAPALVVTGASAEGQAKGYETAQAALLLNMLLGSVGKTITAGNKYPENALGPKRGGTADLVAFARGMAKKRYDVVFVSGTNPLYTAPAALKLQENFSGGFKVVFTQFPDETALAADLVLPMHSNMEDWGTHVAPVQGDMAALSFQQPLMEPLYKDTRGFGDVVLSLLKQRNKDYAGFSDYYAYLQAAIANMPASMAAGLTGKARWMNLLQKGVVAGKGSSVTLKPQLKVASVEQPSVDDAYPLRLLPNARLGMWDGRHANLPWMQEAPDQISKVVWGSWVELHPKTADKLGVHNGDFVIVTSRHGELEAQVYVHKGVHPDAVSMPLGQGHDEYGRYAKGRGANPLKLLAPTVDGKTGELAMFATPVKLAKGRKHEVLVKMGGSEFQLGRKFVRTISADVKQRNEGEV